MQSPDRWISRSRNELMDLTEAVELLRPLVEPGARSWADIGAGEGGFTRALALLLGAGGTVYAVDRDHRAVKILQSLAVSPGEALVVAVQGDLTGALALPVLDGALLANSLHYVSDDQQASTLARVAGLLRPGGRLIVAEYDGRPANPWVPYPVPFARLCRLARTAGLSEPAMASHRPSAYSGILYLAVMQRA
jgi:SAM-dependent methyltransferase